VKTINPKALERMEKVLRAASMPLTLRALSRRLRIPYSTAKRRVDALDATLKKTWVREGRRGAKSVAYSL
jgi:molybdenum-dependent DNA-binding transcriptional regulator ModE